MRTADGRTHAEICTCSPGFCKEGRELEFCQAPSKLREKWDSLQLKKTSGTWSYRQQKTTEQHCRRTAGNQSIGSDLWPLMNQLWCDPNELRRHCWCDGCVRPNVSVHYRWTNPLMAGYWPKSSNQLNSNLRGNAMAYGVMLKGFSANAIREAITDLADKNHDHWFCSTSAGIEKIMLGWCSTGIASSRVHRQHVITGNADLHQVPEWSDRENAAGGGCWVKTRWSNQFIEGVARLLVVAVSHHLNQ